MQKKHLKIAILIDQLTIGGVQKIALEDARSLQKLSNQVEVLVLMRKGYKPQYKDFTKGVKIRFLSDSYPFFLKHSLKFPIFSFFSTLHILSPFLAPFVIKNNEFDVIISHGTTTCFTAQGLKRKRQIPYLAFIHDPMNYILKVAYSKSPLRIIFPVLKPLLKHLEKNLINESEQIILSSKFHQSFISQTYNTKTLILPNTTRVPQKLKSIPRNYILATTRWENKKNPGLLIEISKAVPDAKIKIAGTWTNKQDYREFKKELANLGLSKRIELYPYVSEEGLQNLYQGARLLVHPIKEGFGMGGLEAAANACPIVIHKDSGITQYLIDNQDGIFLPKTTSQDFIMAVKKLWSDPKLAKKMGLSARQKVMKLNSINHAKQLLEIIGEKLKHNEFISLVALETGHASESYLSGGDKLLEKMASYFPENIKINVILPSIGKEHWLFAKLKNVSIEELGKNPFDNKPRPIWVFFAYLFRVWGSYRKLIKLKEADIIYSSTNVLPDVAPAFFYKLTHPGTPWIARVHHLIEHPTKRPGNLLVNIVSYLMQSFSNFMMRSKSDKVIALHSKLANTLVKLKFKKGKLSVLGAGIDFEKINKAKNYEGKSFEGIFVGRIHPSKGVYDVVKIWQEVVKKVPNAKAIIVGGGSIEQEKKLRLQIQKSNLSKNLIFVGYLSDEELYSNLKSSKIFLFTDYEAGWGLAIGEAMAAGLPVIGYNLKVFGGVFKKGYITVPIGNKNIFAEKIIDLLNNPDKYQKLKKEALEQAHQLSWEKASKKIQKIIKKLTTNLDLSKKIS